MVNFRMEGMLREGPHGYRTFVPTKNLGKREYSFDPVYLTPAECRSGRVGDKVIVEYRSHPSRGGWVVTEVLSA